MTVEVDLEGASQVLLEGILERGTRERLLRSNSSLVHGSIFRNGIRFTISQWFSVHCFQWYTVYNFSMVYSLLFLNGTHFTMFFLKYKLEGASQVLLESVLQRGARECNVNNTHFVPNIIVPTDNAMEGASN